MVVKVVIKRKQKFILSRKRGTSLVNQSWTVMASLSLLLRMSASKNNRHDTFSDVKVFLEREHPARGKTIEVVCSSARLDMDRRAKHMPYKLFCHTLQLFPEYVDDATGHAKAATAEWPVAKEWPVQTTIACWHDCHPFTTVPLPIPKLVKNSAGLSANTYSVYGVFCSGNCAVAYILEKNTYDQQQQLMLFKQMAINVFNLQSQHVFEFEPAPPRVFLKLFGGHLSIAEFRQSSLVACNALLTPPFISYSMVLEENARSMAKTASEPNKMTTTTSAATNVSPISCHTIRGLRRPTSTPTTGPGAGPGAGSGAPQTPTAAPITPQCLFSAFVESKHAEALAKQADAPPPPPSSSTPPIPSPSPLPSALEDGVNAASKRRVKTNKAPTRQRQRKKNPPPTQEEEASEPGPSSSSTASKPTFGTLAAFLRPA